MNTPTLDIPPCPGAVAAAMTGWPDHVQAIRTMIFEVAEATGTGPLTETLKWGQPAYLPEATKAGTTVRLGYVAEVANPLRIYVHCQTNLVDRFRERFGDTLTFEGDRAICLSDTDALPDAPLRHCIAMVLNYHRDKRSAHG